MKAKTQHSAELTGLVRGTSYNFAGAIARTLLGFLYVVMLTQILDVSELGLYFLAVNIIVLLCTIALFGLDAGIRRFASIAIGRKDYDAVWDYFLTAARIVIPASLLLVILVCVFADTVETSLFSEPGLGRALRLLAPYLVFYPLAEILLAVTHAFKYMHYRVIALDVSNMMLRIVFTLTLVLLGMTLDAALLAHVAAIFVVMLMSFLFFRWVLPLRTGDQTESPYRQLTSFSLPVSLARLSNTTTGITETVLLGLLATLASVGVYNIALKLALVSGLVLASFNMTFAPVISQLHSQGRVDELQRLYASVTRWVFAFSLPVLLFVAANARWVMQLFGDEYAAGSSALVVLCLGQLLNMAAGPSGIMLLMSGRSFTNLAINAGGLFLNIALNVLLIPTMGILGAAFAFAIAVAVMNMTRVVLVARLLKMHPYDAAFVKVVGAGTLGLATVTLVLQWLPAERGLVVLLAAGAAYAVVFLLLLARFGIDETDQYILRRLYRRVARDRTRLQE